VRRTRGWRTVRTIAMCAVALVLAVALVTGVLTIWSVRRAMTQLGGELRLPGLSASVTVYRDRYGIPQVFASSIDDLVKAQGYLHAQDRFWEMDFRRHVTAGRLAELFGPDQVASDAYLRTLGWRQVVAQEWNQLAPATRHYLQSYADGVNAWLASNSGGEASLEYSVLGLTNRDYTIEKWGPLDSLAWLKAMAWDLWGNLPSEVNRALLLANGLTREQVERLYPGYPYDRHEPIVSAADGSLRGGAFQPTQAAPLAAPAKRDGWTDSVAAATGADRIDAAPEVYRDAAAALRSVRAGLAALPHLLNLGSDGIGSNSWVVSGKYTATGKPFLANDPHLSPSMPGIWYQMGLHCSCSFNAEGFTFSGVPGVVIGHNARIAWGFTNLDPDVTDLYLEKVDGDRVFDGKLWQPLTDRQEVIDVAGGTPVTITVRSTKHGPLLSDRSQDMLTVAARPDVDASGAALPSASAAPVPSLGGDSGGTPAAATATRYAVALRWTALDPGHAADALFGIDTAQNWTDFRAAAALFDVPAQNMVYADVAGNIGYQSPGRVPIRGAGDGRWPAPGWDPAYDWRGYLPFAELPTVVNPPEGYLVTANQAVVGADYPRLLTRDWDYGYRSQRIRDLIEQTVAAGRQVDGETIRRMQFDNRNGLAPDLVPALLAAPASGAVARARDLLRGWDFQQPAQSPAASSAAAAFFNATWRNLIARTFDELPAELAPSGGPRWWEVVRGLLDQPNSPWWDERDTSTVETMSDELAAAMRDATTELTKRLGGDPGRWRWGDLHTLTLTNQTFGESGIAPIEWLFNRGPAGVSGGDAIVNATGWDASAADPYAVDAVPSMRMIVDLSNLDGSRWIQLTGESGHAFSENYSDQFELWRTGENLPMRWDRATIERAATHVLVLRP
jgi:penicillin G amidase